MNPQLTNHGYLHNDDNFYEVAEEFIMDFYEDAEECITDETNQAGDHDIAEVSQIISGSHVTEHSDSQRLPHRPEEKGECTTLTEQSVDLPVPKGSLSDILSAQEDKNGDQKNLVEEKDASNPFQHRQDQQQQQPPPVERLYSDYPLLEQEVGKVIAEDLLEHQTAKHDSETLQEAGPGANFHSCNDIESTEGLRATDSEAEQKNSAGKVIPPTNRDIDEKDDMRAMDSSHNPHPRRLFSATKTLFSVIVSTFALIMVGKLLRHR